MLAAVLTPIKFFVLFNVGVMESRYHFLYHIRSSMCATWRDFRDNPGSDLKAERDYPVLLSACSH